MRRFLFVLAAVTLGGCTLSTEAENHPTDPATETFAASLKVDIPTMVKTPSGAYYKDLVPGTGAELTGLPTITVAYQTFLKTGAVVGNVASGTQLLSLMVPGLREAMQGMKVNGERLIVVPSALAYGNSSAVVGVPPNSTLVFDILLKAVSVQ